MSNAYVSGRAWVATDTSAIGNLNKTLADILSHQSLFEAYGNTVFSGGQGSAVVDGATFTAVTGQVGGCYCAVAGRTETLSPSTYYYVYLHFNGWTYSDSGSTVSAEVVFLTGAQASTNYLLLFNAQTSTAGLASAITNQTAVGISALALKMNIAGGTFTGAVFGTEFSPTSDGAGAIGGAALKWLNGYFSNLRAYTAYYMGANSIINSTRDATLNSLAILATGYGVGATGIGTFLSGTFGNAGQATINNLGVGAFAAGTTIGGAAVITSGTSPSFATITATTKVDVTGTAWDALKSAGGIVFEKGLIGGTHIYANGTAYTMDANDQMVQVNQSADGVMTLTLPAADVARIGRLYLFINDQATNNLIVERAGTDTISGGTTFTITPNRWAWVLQIASNRWIGGAFA